MAKVESGKMREYLASSEHIDWKSPEVLTMANSLAGGASDSTEIARACFEFVRDQIKHSWDFQLNPVTCNASDVLKHRTGFCYAKSHLLAALLPPAEKLAFAITQPGEADLPEIWAEPMPMIVRALQQGKTFQEVAENLPDIELVIVNPECPSTSR